MRHSLRVRVVLAVLGLMVVATGVTAPGCFLEGFRSTPTDQSAEPSGRAVICFGYVDVPQGIVRLTSEQPGRIVAVLVEEGQLVEADTPLIRLDDRRQQALLRQADSAVASAEAKREQARLLVSLRETEYRTQQLALEAAATRLATARRRLSERREQLPPGRVEELEDLIRDLTLAHQAEEARLRQAQTQIDLAQRQADEAEQAVAAADAQRQQAQLAVEAAVVKAPVRGEVLRLRARVGGLAAPTAPEPLVEFAPDEPRIIRAEVPQEFAARVQLGATCLVTDDANPTAGRWRGRVARIADWYAQRRTVLPEPLQLHDVRTLECIVQLDPGQPRPRIGQRVQVTIGPHAP